VRSRPGRFAAGLASTSWRALRVRLRALLCGVGGALRRGVLPWRRS
jgi:hypothetical protein